MTDEQASALIDALRGVADAIECAAASVSASVEVAATPARDLFAAAALAGGLEQGVENDMGSDPYRASWWHHPDKIAERAYAIADAMMAAG